jgi:malonate transporter
MSRGGAKPHIARDVAVALLRNPLVVAPAAGLLLSATGIGLPTPIETFFNLLGAASGPCALFAVGLFIIGKPFHGNVPELVWLSILKLLIQPAVTWVLAFPVLGLDPFWGGSAVLLAGLPTGALVFTLAQNYDVWPEAASAVIIVTTILSVVTVSAILVLTGLT